MLLPSIERQQILGQRQFVCPSFSRNGHGSVLDIAQKLKWVNGAGRSNGKGRVILVMIGSGLFVSLCDNVVA